MSCGRDRRELSSGDDAATVVTDDDDDDDEDDGVSTKTMSRPMVTVIAVGSATAWCDVECAIEVIATVSASATATSLSVDDDDDDDDADTADASELFGGELETDDKASIRVDRGICHGRMAMTEEAASRGTVKGTLATEDRDCVLPESDCVVPCERQR